MHEQEQLIMYNEVVVVQSPLLKRERGNKYGTVPGLDDNELADPGELERQVFEQEFAPIMTLPIKHSCSRVRPNIDESGSINWGAFGTVDFERTMPQPNESSSRIAALHEERRDVLIRLGIVTARLPKAAMHKMLMYLRKGVIGMEHIVNEDIVWVVQLDRRARRISREITRTLERRREREQRAVEATLGQW